MEVTSTTLLCYYVILLPNGHAPCSYTYSDSETGGAATGPSPNYGSFHDHSSPEIHIDKPCIAVVIFSLCTNT